ncbi:hypothetical protein HMPREF3231_00316 [Bifidobacterium longum]|nr:hypothetical protein HMPREF3231_00316 [Bifidobacterium longum]
MRPAPSGKEPELRRSDVIQILVGVFMGKNHRDQGDGRNTHHVPGRGDG